MKHCWIFRGTARLNGKCMRACIRELKLMRTISHHLNYAQHVVSGPNHMIFEIESRFSNVSKKLFTSLWVNFRFWRFCALELMPPTTFFWVKAVVTCVKITYHIFSSLKINERRLRRLKTWFWSLYFKCHRNECLIIFAKIIIDVLCRILVSKCRLKFSC